MCNLCLSSKGSFKPENIPTLEGLNDWTLKCSSASATYWYLPRPWCQVWVDQLTRGRACISARLAPTRSLASATSRICILALKIELLPRWQYLKDDILIMLKRGHQYSIELVSDEKHKEKGKYKYKTIKEQSHGAFQCKLPKGPFEDFASSILSFRPLAQSFQVPYAGMETGRSVWSGRKTGSKPSALNDHLCNASAAQGLAAHQILLLQTGQSVEKTGNKKDDGGGD